MLKELQAVYPDMRVSLGLGASEDLDAVSTVYVHSCLSVRTLFSLLRSVSLRSFFRRQLGLMFVRVCVRRDRYGLFPAMAGATAAFILGLIALYVCRTSFICYCSH